LVYENSSKEGKFAAEKRERHETHTATIRKAINRASRESRKREHPMTTGAVECVTL